MVYIVMREKGFKTNGWFYESITTVLGVKDTEINANQLLDKAIKKYHPNEQPINIRALGPSAKGIAFLLSGELYEELYDNFWIETFGDNEERLTDDNDEGV